MTHIRLSKVILALALVMTILCGSLSLDGWQGIRFTPAPAKAEAVSDNLTDDSGWQYRLLTDGNAQITGYSDAAATALTVPLSLGGLWVTSIAGGSFTTLEQLQSLTIPASVTDIATNALSGLSDVKIRAYNGSAALAFASLTGLPAQCLSEYEFFSDVLDLSDMRSAQFTFQGNGVRIASPFSQLISVGQKLFLPASRQYQNGFACQVTALTEGSAYVLAQVAELGIMDAVEHYRAEDVQLTPDVGGVVILEEGFSVNQGGGSSFGQTAPRGWGGSATLSGSVSFDVNIKFNKNVSIVGNIKYTPNYTASIEFDWFKLQEISYSAISTFSYSLGLKCEGDPEKKSTNKPITFAAIPLTSTGLLSAWAECSMTINSSGTVIVTSSITTTETVTWKVGHRIETTKSKSVTPLHISAAIEASITYGASVLLRVGFGKCKTDIAKIGASIGYTFELQHATNALFCIDVSSKVTFSVKLQLGIIEDTRDTRSLVFNAELFKVDFIFPPLHWEASLSRFVDKCQANIIPVVFCFSSDPNTFIRNSASIHSTLQQPPAPTREGYTFTGWYKTSDCVDLWDFEWDFVPNCDELLLYAGWTLNGTDPIAPTPTPTATGDPTPTPAPTATVDPTLPFEPEGVGSTGTYEGLTYAKYVNGIIITDCETGVTSVSIPAWIDGVPVKAIADQAFFDCSRLTSVIIPNGVTSIGVRAFISCTSLTSITIPNSVIRIWSDAFY
ncbi:MAG: leucine-rich repeat protein, partial [Clostridia bacterium]